MATISHQHLTNPLVTSSQLINFQSTTTTTTTISESSSKAQSIRFAQSLLTQSAGILLRLPQEVTATALILLQRHWVSSANAGVDTRPASGSKKKFSARTISAAVLYLTAKLSFTPVSPRSVINVYAYLSSSVSPLWFVNPDSGNNDKNGGTESGPVAVKDAKEYYVSEGTYERRRIQLFAAETYVLFTLGFETQVSLPHQLALTYLQALGVTGVESDKLSLRVIEHLNGALLSPQLLYLTHQLNVLAVAAIYLSAKETSVKLPELNWWEVFDVDREDLGFCVLALGSLERFAEAEREKWNGRPVPLD